MLDFFLSKIFPPVCVWCHNQWAYICWLCKKKLLLHPEICLVCKKPNNDFFIHRWCGLVSKSSLVWCVIVFCYYSLIKKILLKIKYSHRRHYLSFLVSQSALLLRAHCVYVNDMTCTNTIITWVPSHWRRHYFIKWYNQSTMIAKALATELWYQYSDITRKVRHTWSQVWRTRQQRQQNVSDVFFCHKTLPKNVEYIIICDDVTTTGATLQALAFAIQQVNPHVRIRWCAVARHA